MEFLIAHVSDLHVGSAEFIPEKLDTCIDEINNLSPDLIALTGDLTMNGFEREYKEAKRYIDRFKAKTIVIPGNHDTKSTGYIYFEEYFGEGNQVVDLGGVTVVGVDSTLPDRDEGYLGRSRQRWLDEHLSSVEENDFKVVLVHHHLIPVPGTGMERNELIDAGDALATLVANRVNLALCGHRHVPYTWKLENLMVITSGTACTGYVRARIPQAYFIISLRDKTMEITLKEVGGRETVIRSVSY
ncbi:MAG: metallophosphoesterase family protein [Candidatus Freyarchaeota archaeon]